MTEREIFAEALQLQSGVERAAFLDQAAGCNSSLRCRVDSLLNEVKVLGNFLEGPPREVADHVPTVQTGTWIGRYRLAEPVGEGGMGTVWFAEQTDPVKRRVALKLIKPGMDSRQVLSRFEAERQALALMDHPHIARVYDGGMTGEGRPYFVMEYVAGVPITEYCEKANLPIRERLQLFVQVCDAVHHAHQKGVIHRDLKPSNILVGRYGSAPVPKIIDFGLAKAIGAPLTEHTCHTGHGLMIGTPLYMSPEQAELNNPDIDTRTDIYSLGAILYELLTGTTPIEKDRIASASLPEILRQIKEVEPPRPSQRLAQLRSGESGSNPHTSPPRSKPRIRDFIDLDWIVMKAIDKDRARRYASASGLAEDVSRYLRGDPIEAGPPSAVYRLSRLVRRYRGWISVAVAFAALLVLATAISAWQARRAKFAEAKASLAQEQAIALAAAEKSAREEAEQRRVETTAVLKFLQDNILQRIGSSIDRSSESTFRETVQSVLPLIESNFKREPLLEAGLRQSLGRALVSLNDRGAAAEQYQAAYRLYAAHLGPEARESLQAARNLAYSYDYLGRHTDASELYQRTYEIRKRTLGPDHQDTLWDLQHVAINYMELGRFKEAIDLHEQAHAIRTANFPSDDRDLLASMQWLATAYGRAGRKDDASRLFREFLNAKRAKLGSDHEETLTSMRDVARSFFDLGLTRDGFELLEEEVNIRTIKLGPDHRETLRAAHELANRYFEFGRRAEALALRQATLETRRRSFAPDDPDTLLSMQELARSFANAGRHQEAMKLDLDVLERRRAKLGGSHLDTLTSMNNLAHDYAAQGRHDDALELREKTLELRQQQLGTSHAQVLISMRNLAASYSAVGRHEEAIELAKMTLQIYRARFGSRHRFTFPAWRVLAGCHAAAGQHADALQEWEEALSLHQSTFSRSHPDTLIVLRGTAESLVALDRRDEAVALLDECLQLAAGQLIDPAFVAAADEVRRRARAETSGSDHGH